MKRLVFPAVALVLLTAFSGADKKLNERQRALHVLNRLAFGPRPGDVDKVMKDGVDVWIDQQLHPESIPDRTVEARLQSLPTLRMTNGEIMETYYRPIVEARRERKAGEALGVEPSGEVRMAQQKSRQAA